LVPALAGAAIDTAPEIAKAMVATTATILFEKMLLADSVDANIWGLSMMH
jgi:hypothetical protein